MDTLQLSFTLGTTNPQAHLGLQVLLDNQPVFTQEHVTDTQPVTIDIAAAEGDHELSFVMTGKTAQDTVISETGEIITDSCLTIGSVAFDEIELNHILNQLSEYSHDFNGSGKPTTEKFYGTMGCNGTVSLKFTSPIYLWLLEHM